MFSVYRRTTNALGDYNENHDYKSRNCEKAAMIKK